jgi:hypothetical protein
VSCIRSIPPLSLIPSSICALFSIYNGSSLRQSPPGKVPAPDKNRRKSMQQLSLFPPPGALTQPLPNEVQMQARQQLAELLAAVLETAAEEPTSREGEHRE